MCEDTTAADQITRRLNADEAFKELNGKTINLHTNLKGKLKKIGKGSIARMEFIENEKEISDEDLKALRKLSRELDQNTSPYHCIVSVLMLREGWDVRNVTTIVPLRPYTSKANILPEQTLGRGLRRMIPPGSDGANEIVTVVEHQAFASLYQQELAQEGLPIEIVDVDHIPTTTVSIYPNPNKANYDDLEIELPRLTPGHKVLPKLEGLTIEDVKQAFEPYKPLPLGDKGSSEIQYEGRNLLTNEIIERMKIDLPLLDTGVGAISYYIKQFEYVCKIRNLHTSLAPILETFIQDVLFEKQTSLFDQACIARLGDPDVGEHIRAIFIPLIRSRTTTIEKRLPSGGPTRLSDWRPYQVTHSEKRPALEANKTLFNLVPCNRELEVAMANFLDRAADVAAFAKNAGRQSLRIDYLASGGRIAFYTPDFFARSSNGVDYLIETKGREDLDVPRKARAAIEWCKSASKTGADWHYLYVPQGVFEQMRGNSVEELARTCNPALQTLLKDVEPEPQIALSFEDTQEAAPKVTEIIDSALIDSLPPRYKKAVTQAVMIYQFFGKKEGMNYSPVFNALLGSLDEAAKGVLMRRLEPELPSTIPDQKAWFDPYMDNLAYAQRKHYGNMTRNLKKTLIFNNGISPIGLLRSCLEYALNDSTELGGVFNAARARFGDKNNSNLLDTLQRVNDFRNTRIAHQEEELTDKAVAEEELRVWVKCLSDLTKA